MILFKKKKFMVIIKNTSDLFFTFKESLNLLLLQKTISLSTDLAALTNRTQLHKG